MPDMHVIPTPEEAARAAADCVAGLAASVGLPQVASLCPSPQGIIQSFATRDAARLLKTDRCVVIDSHSRD